MDILEKLKNNYSSIKEEDIEKWILPEIVSHYEKQINFYVYKIYTNPADLNKKAWKENAKIVLGKCLNTFIFKARHWENGRDINTYLLTSLKRQAANSYWEQQSADKGSFLICPVCREYNLSNFKSFLISQDKKWYCENCSKESERLSEELVKNKIPKEEIAITKAKIAMYKHFMLHSRKGYHCGEPSCNRFIPESINGKYGIQCPYIDCDFFGKIEDLTEMAHPSATKLRKILSLDFPIENSNKGSASFGSLSPSQSITLQNKLDSNSLQADNKLIIQENFDNEYKILLTTIEEQIKLVEKSSSKITKIPKLMMYQAYKNMLEFSSEDMISYLVHQKNISDTSFQCKIFQEYIKLMENALPFSIQRKGKNIDILSISDPDLGLFTGVSVFDATVENGIIPNQTIETYVGGREFKNFGSCFIGKIIDIKNKNTNESMISMVNDYSFTQIRTSIPDKTKVIVYHYRIPSHYEIGHMVFVQRIRKNLVDKVYFRINNSKRIPCQKKIKNENKTK